MDAGVSLQFSGIESHNSIGIGERYHARLRRIFMAVTNQHPKLPKELVLRLAIKALNDTMGPHGLVPSLLVFGVLPTCPAPVQSRKSQVERFKAMNTARREMEAYVAEQRIKTALKSRLPPATKFNIQLGQSVRVYREQERKWVGPYTVDRISHKTVHVTDGTTVKPFNITQVIPADTKLKDVDWKHTENTLTTTVDNNFAATFLVEVLRKSDPRFHTLECQHAILKDLKGLR